MEAIDQEFFETVDYANYSEASKGKRFANFVIDILSFYLVIFILSFLLGVLQFLFKTDLTSWLSEINSIIDRIITTLLLVVYLSLVEFFFKGRTLGKLITKTKAVNEDGTIMNGNETIIRNLCRLIPFDVLSFLIGDTGWHDSVSHTRVVDLTEPNIPETIIPENQ